jgi:hypothetical protein
MFYGDKKARLLIHNSSPDPLFMQTAHQEIPQQKSLAREFNP